MGSSELPDAVAAPVAADPRTRILDAALELMSSQGSAGASMRQLAAACGLNVATIYHYFPSKADLLRSVMAERRYGERLGSESPDLDPAVPPRERLAGLFEWLWGHALAEEAVWRLLIGEALRGEDAATTGAAEVVAALSTTLEAWLEQGFPELVGDRRRLADLIRGQVFALVVEHLALGGVSPATARDRAAALAALVFAEDG
jgi:AcrR family transcriptional regulator